VLVQVTKYGQRGGWSARDLLRLAHPQADFIRVQAARTRAEQAAGDSRSRGSQAAAQGAPGHPFVL
jgi:TROVE domain